MDIDGYRQKVRECRLMEPLAQDRTQNLRALADRRHVIASLTETALLENDVTDSSGTAWLNEAEYGAEMFQKGEAAAAKEGR
eukprot:326014-Alexandrium_andersonii.AAC.1